MSQPVVGWEAGNILHTFCFLNRDKGGKQWNPSSSGDSAGNSISLAGKNEGHPYHPWWGILSEWSFTSLEQPGGEPQVCGVYKLSKWNSRLTFLEYISHIKYIFRDYFIKMFHKCPIYQLVCLYLIKKNLILLIFLFFPSCSVITLHLF